MSNRLKIVKHFMAIPSNLPKVVVRWGGLGGFYRRMKKPILDT
ncbi:hypothetical protein QWZ13_19300 [Reinekea marina]|nr:hypothetical protein [Reinekea marina]MDN3647306.1 hypothetical protein [Reinekea marina]MDN3651062.1 hypothetical protein [Reinekea marina]